MSEYVKAVNNVIQKYPYTLEELKLEYPNISFPKVMTDEQLANYNVYTVVFGDVEEFSDSEYVERDTEPTYTDGVWTLHFKIKPKTYWPTEL